MFANRIKKGCILLVLASQATVAWAQTGSSESFYTPRPPEYRFRQHHSSTAYEGARRADAQYVYSVGAYWLLVRQSLIYREQARRLAIENRDLFVQSQQRYWKGLAQDRQKRIADRRQFNELSRPTVYSVYRLSPRQLDRVTGAIAWPQALQTAEYRELRESLDAHFRDIAAGADPTTCRTAEIVRCTLALSEAVRRDRGSMTSVEYLAVEKFLAGVKYEAEFPLECAS